mgnify:CR=1 FL=1
MANQQLHNDTAIPDEIITYYFGSTSFYNHKPDDVQKIQTHASYVFIAPPWVYKIKKPVDFGFLDYSTLTKRRYYCFREVELNSRLCADIYEGVVPIIRDDNKLRTGDILTDENADDHADEYAVKMRYMPEENFLKQKIHDNSNTVTTDEIDRISATLKDFYLRQKPDDSVSRWGEIDRIKINTDENFEQTNSFIGHLIPSFLHKVIQEFTDRYFKRNKSLFEKRIANGRIVDGHGDLHLEHIHITDEKVCIYDCIEFNDRLRYQDLANDLAFLAMDLDFHGRPQLEYRLISNMARYLEDDELFRLMDFYKCYRAFVRAKVTGIQLQDADFPDTERTNHEAEARQYFNLAGRYAVLGSRPVAIIIMGRIGTGKSTVRKRLSRLFGIPDYSSDRIRKLLAGLPPEQASPQEIHSYLYSQEMSEETYEKLYQKSIEELKHKRPVVMDATFSRRKKRVDLVKRLEEAGYRYLFIEMKTSDAVIKKRLEYREEAENIVSDARLENFENLDTIYQEPNELSNRQLIEVNTEQHKKETLSEIVNKIMYLHLDWLEK